MTRVSTKTQHASKRDRLSRSSFRASKRHKDRPIKDGFTPDHAMPPVSNDRSLPKRLALGIVRAVLTVFIVLDEMARPLYRPLIRWFSSLRLVHRLEEAVAGLPRPLVLLALAVPFAIAEPLKLLGLVMMARGAFWPGLIVLGLAHLAE